MMTKLELDKLTEEQINFQLILHSGTARSKIIQSLREYREGNVESSNRLLQEAENDLQIAHDVHFQMIKREANGLKTEFSLLLLHGEDHLMSTLTMKELVREMLELFKAKNL
ncbi:PTS system, cellobiose-specific IIA component [Priestia endophytica DSM 13796]|uniref:PTS system, cellobiose-specific IIA component n=2 Tax=Priestia endophytica TaxID=135735 RepID=A0A1I6BZC1_9BACI|nr:PTS system, cellobiose-specific IIA component [Priestia endophytica DSM 13796]